MMSHDKPNDKYSEIFREIKEEKMDWDFEDFLKQVEAPQEEGKIIQMRPNGNKPRIPKFFWMAAGIALILGMFFLMKMKNQPPTVQQQHTFVKNQILKQKNDDEFLAVNETENQDSAVAKEKDSVVQNIMPEKEAEEVMNKILSKKSRLKKAVRQKYARAEPIKPTEKTKTTIQGKSPEYQENFVIINGQKIKNENEAIDVAKYSLQMLSSQVSQTIAKTEPLTEFTD